MVRHSATKLFDTSGGAEVQKELKKSVFNSAQQEVIFGRTSLYGIGRQFGGLLNEDEAKKIPKRNQSGSLTRVPPSVLQSVSKRSLTEGERVAQGQSSKTRRRIATLARAQTASNTPDGVDDDPFSTFDDFCDVPASEIFNTGIDDESNHAESNRMDMRYIHFIETMQGPAVVHRRRRRNQTRKEKKDVRQRKWNSQENDLADALLKWFASARSYDPTGIANLDIDAPPPLPIPGSKYFSVDICALQWFRGDWPIADINAAYRGQSLIASGVLSNAPDTPSWAVSIRTLETYRLLRLAKPNYSIQSFTRAMSMAQQRTNSTSLQEKFADVFDLYLQLRRNIERRLSRTMGRDGPKWHIRHFCPACTHTVPGEESLKYQFGYSIDGGNSAKRWDGAGAASEGREFTDDHQIRISRTAVDRFKGVVKRRKVKKRQGRGRGNQAEHVDDDLGSDSASNASEHDIRLELDNETTEVVDGDEYIVKNIQGDPTAEGDQDGDCVRNWKANADDSKKGMFDCFDESGAFVGVCKHGILIIYCDMVHSGELAKYPIAITEAIESEFPDVSKMEGYDIWCVFVKTLLKAGIIINGDGTTLSMHGYGHNRLCQLQYHPIYRIHAGLADFEQCERFFSGFNSIASVTRHSSTFHRHQWIDMYCRQSNADKLENIGTYLFNNYRQALGLIEELERPVRDMQRRLGLSNANIETMGKEESEYIEKMTRSESEEESTRCLYFEALNKLWDAEEIEKERLTSRAGAAPALNTRNKGKRKSKKSVAAILADTELYLERVNELEALLNISQRWTKSSPEYVETSTYYNERAYHKAANNLRAQVIQRLMELAKCHMPNTNYRVRTNINKHVQTRSKAIPSIIRTVNKAARKLGKPPLTSKQVFEDTFLDNFHILCDSRSEIRNKNWANSENRQLRDKYYKLQCARYEIRILNVEIGRVFAWMDAELLAYDNAIKKLGNNWALESWARFEQKEVKRKLGVIAYWLRKCEQLDDYSGKKHRCAVDNDDTHLPADDDPEEDSEEICASVDVLDSVLINIDRQG